MAKRRAKQRLLADLDGFVRGRLVLALLPVSRRLVEDGAMGLAEAVGLAALDVRHNLAHILGGYEIGEKDER